ncbi:phage tail tape measure protein [Halorarum salinum]|nr:phage tail tape measure protein [Halobaculum salinum]
MQQSIAVLGDVDEAMREDLEQTAREVATSTTQSHEEAAQSFYFLASAGLTAAEAMEAMPQVAAFAEAGQMDMAEATDVATNVMSAFGYEAEEMNEVTDTLTATVTSHNQTMDGMAQAMSRVAPTAAGMGVEIEEAAAAIGLLGDVGIQGRRAGTSLNRALTVLANPTGRAAERINELGVNVRDANGDLRSITEIMSDFEAAGASSADMAAIFGSEAGPAMSSLLQQGGDAIAESTDRLREAEGATQDVADTQRETLNAELQVMRSNLEEAGVAIGANLLPMLSTLSGHVQRAGQWFAGLSDNQQKVIIAFGGVLAAIGPVLLALGTLGTLLPAAATGATMAAGAFGTMWTALLGPIGLVLAAIAAFGAAYATNFLGVKDLTNDVVGGVMDNLDLLKGWVLTAIGPIGWLYMAWESNFLGIQNATADAKDAVLDNLDLLATGILAALGPIGWFVIAYRKNFMGVGDATDEVIGRVVDGINWLISKITQIPSELQNLIDRIPGVDGEEVADKLFPPTPAEERARETGESAAEAAEEGASEEAASASSKEQQLLSGGGDPYAAGEDVGADMAAGATAGIEGELGDGPIKGEMTDAMRSVLESGVEGYVSDPDEIEDAPTEINEALFNAMAESQGGATAERLGVSEQEFVALSNRFGGTDWSGGGGSGGGSAPADVMASGATGSNSGGGGGGPSAADIASALRSVLQDLVLEGDLDVDDSEFEEAINGTVRAEFGRERDRLDRGVGG